jgi:hypothetical protein
MRVFGLWWGLGGHPQRLAGNASIELEEWKPPLLDCPNRKERGHQMKLIAKWKRELDPGVDEPSTVVWEDGNPATMADYRTHKFDTHCLYSNDDGEMERHMDPDIVADVSFAERPGLGGPGARCKPRSARTA